MSMSSEDLQRLEDAYQADAYQRQPRKPALDPEVVGTWLAMLALLLLFFALAIVVGIRLTDWVTSLTGSGT